ISSSAIFKVISLVSVVYLNRIVFVATGVFPPLSIILRRILCLDPLFHSSQSSFVLSIDIGSLGSLYKGFHLLEIFDLPTKRCLIELLIHTLDLDENVVGR